MIKIREYDQGKIVCCRLGGAVWIVNWEGI